MWLEASETIPTKLQTIVGSDIHIWRISYIRSDMLGLKAPLDSY